MMYRFKQPLGLEIEYVVDDLRQMQLDLADSDTELIGPLLGAGNLRKADVLLNEVLRLAHQHKNDLDFARTASSAIMMHADARASQGAIEQVPKAVETLLDLAGTFENPEFVLRASMLLRVATRRAAAGNVETARSLFDRLQQLAGRNDAPSGVVADYAAAAMAVCSAYQEQQRYDDMNSIARRAASAIRSEAYRKRLLEEGANEHDVEKLQQWVASLGGQ
jgi:hypothetical protein